MYIFDVETWLFTYYKMDHLRKGERKQKPVKGVRKQSFTLVQDKLYSDMFSMTQKVTYY